MELYIFRWTCVSPSHDESYRPKYVDVTRLFNIIHCRNKVSFTPDILCLASSLENNCAARCQMGHRVHTVTLTRFVPTFRRTSENIGEIRSYRSVSNRKDDSIIRRISFNYFRWSTRRVALNVSSLFRRFLFPNFPPQTRSIHSKRSPCKSKMQR